MKKLNHILSLALALLVALGCLTGQAFSASAATISDATIDMDKLCRLDLYKYDWTNATKDGVWAADSYVSTGKYDPNINDILGGSNRVGDSDKVSDLENGKTSNGYAVAGVEFTYLKVAEFLQFSESGSVKVLYKFDKELAADLLEAIGLEDGKDSHKAANAANEGYYCYASDVLIKALRDALTNNSTAVKNALESYIKANGGTAMPLTDANGWTYAKDLPIGLYLVVETKVPEMVTNTANPFLVSLPMTTNDGHDWNYNVTVYPKNETGIVTLEKTVREEKQSPVDEFTHNATASDGDTLNYQIISTLPNITSKATYISEYTFRDVLAKGLAYDKDGIVTIEIYSDDACENLIATWKETDENMMFTVSREQNEDLSHTMTIRMTDAGLAAINPSYANCTMRITYDAILNSDESVIYGDEGNCNQVVLTWKRSSNDYYDTLVDDCHVYTYGINLTKTFSDGKEDQDLFNHVLFKLQNESDGYYVVAELNEKEGVWYVTGHTSEESAATAMHPVTWNEKKGQLVIKGLEDDAYILTEIETANGYILLKDDIDIVISAAIDEDRHCDVYDEQNGLGVIQNDARYGFDGGYNLKLANIAQEQLAHDLMTASATVDGNAVTMLSDEKDTESTNALAPLEVVNTRGFELPQTGETGAKWMPIIGGAMIALAAICLFVVIFWKRKDEAEEEVL